MHAPRSYKAQGISSLIEACITAERHGCNKKPRSSHTTNYSQPACVHQNRIHICIGPEVHAPNTLYYMSMPYLDYMHVIRLVIIKKPVSMMAIIVTFVICSCATYMYTPLERENLHSPSPPPAIFVPTPMEG